MIDWNDAFEYRDGLLYWKIKTNRNMKIGRLAGSMAGNGYMQGSLLWKSATDA